MADESLRKGHLDREELNPAAKDAIPKIVHGLPTCNWEDRDGDGLFQKVKLGDLPKFSEHVSTICESCKINRPYGYVIIRYDETETIPSDRFSVVVPLQIHGDSDPKIVDKDPATGREVEKDITVNWVTYITRDVQTTPSVTILLVMRPGEKGTKE